MIRATLVYIFVGAFILLLAPVAMIWTLIVRNTRLIYRLARTCIRAAGLICGVHVIVQGREKVLPEKTYVFLSNHQGNCDGPVLCHVIPRDWIALIKKEMMHLPILSLVLRQIQFVPIDRTNPKKSQEGIEVAVELLKEGKSFIAFPEGTRSRNGRLGSFKKGVFIMAIKAQVPIIPITILGSDQIQPPGSYGFRPGTIQVIFHDPISTQGMDLEDRHHLVQLARDAIASELPIQSR